MKRIIAIILLVVFVFCSYAFAESATEYTELSKGSKGEAVKALQERLKELGYYTSKVDSSYGNGTVKAISAFQARNGLEQDGIATVELQELLYSDEARKAPVELRVYPSNLKLTSTQFRYSISNSSDEAVDSVRTVQILYGPDNQIVSDQALTYDKNYLTKDWGYANTIKSKGKHSNCYGNSDTYGWALSVAKKGAIAVISYHTASGEVVTISPDQLTFYFSDGTVQYPSEDIEPYVYSDTESSELSQIKLGATTKNIYPWTADYYSVEQGLYLLEVQPGTLLGMAGLQAGDIITEMDGKPAIEVRAVHDAQRKLLNNESVEISYSRNGVADTVIIPIDVNAEQASIETAPSNETPEEKLARYDELLGKGLITQDEYDLLKNGIDN